MGLVLKGGAMLSKPLILFSIDGWDCAGRNINNLRYADDTTLMVESEEELKKLDESERGE